MIIIIIFVVGVVVAVVVFIVVAHGCCNCHKLEKTNRELRIEIKSSWGLSSSSLIYTSWENCTNWAVLLAASCECKWVCYGIDYKWSSWLNMVDYLCP
jgi:hypothetical protein